MENRQVRVIKPRANMDPSSAFAKQIKKRVCAYVRVSTDNEEQKTSYVAQSDEYSNRIQNNPDWTFSGIYADEGISGTSTKHRKQFNLMIETARKGEIDLIMTKSISRFARNTVDCLNFIREMRSINVEIFFEKENIYSSDPKVDFLLTIMSSIAQEEARNTSENVKWNVQKRFNNGIPIVNTTRFLGYTKDKKGGNLVVVPDEAKLVQRVFQMYVSGVGPQNIAKHMESIGAITGAGATKWSISTVQSILKNEKYTGDLVQQKTITVDYLTHRKVKNNDIAPKFHIENSHEAIVDKETYLLAQRIRADRAKVKIGDNKNLAKYKATYPFSAFIVCSECGRHLMRRYWNYNKPSQRVMQQCGGYIEGKGTCKAKATYHEMIEGATVHMLNEVFLNDKDILATIQQVIKATIRISDIELKIIELRKKNENTEMMISNLIDMQVKNQNLTELDFNTMYQTYSNQLKETNLEVQRLEAEYVTNYDTRARLAKIESTLKQMNEPITEVDGDILRSFIYRMISVKPDEIVFCIAGNKNYGDKEFSARRHEFEELSPIAEGVFRSQIYEKLMRYKVVVI